MPDKPTKRGRPFGTKRSTMRVYSISCEPDDVQWALSKWKNLSIAVRELIHLARSLTEK